MAAAPTPTPRRCKDGDRSRSRSPALACEGGTPPPPTQDVDTRTFDARERSPGVDKGDLRPATVDDSNRCATEVLSRSRTPRRNSHGGKRRCSSSPPQRRGLGRGRRSRGADGCEADGEEEAGSRESRKPHRSQTGLGARRPDSSPAARASSAKRWKARGSGFSASSRVSPCASPTQESRRGADTGEDRRTGRPRALFLMGLPGAGKTTVKRRRLRPSDVDIEPDKFKRRHPRYSEDMGDRTDDEVHRWSVRRAVDAFEDVVNAPDRRDVVLDSSGSNVQWLRRRIDVARDNGYAVELLWVDVPLEIALLRNRDRASRRGDRTMVPDKVIIDKSKVMQGSFDELRREVDSAERLQNWNEGSDELKRAQDDVYFYPPPRTRPPALRFGDKGYGEPPSGARSPSPSAGSRRKMLIGPWKRGDDVMREKNKRLEWMDRTFRGNRERYVMDHVLCGRDVLVEPNRYPYQLPPDVEHWTIWSTRTMRHKELCDHMESWLDAREPHNVKYWNYDDNHGRRTIDIWHVHVYFQGCDGKPPRLRKWTRGDSKCDEKRPLPASSRHRSSPCSV